MCKLILIVLFAVPLLSQPRELYKDNYLADNTLNKDAKLYANAHVKSESTYEINKQTQGNKRLSGKRTFTTSGLVAANTVIDDEGYTETQFIYTYDELNRMVNMREEYYHKDTLQSTVNAAYKYAADGKITEVIYSNSAGFTQYRKYRYNTDSNMVTYLDYDEFGQLNTTSKFVFNNSDYLQNVEIMHKDQVQSLIARYYDDSVQISHLENGKFISYETMLFDDEHRLTGVRLTSQGSAPHLDYKAEYSGQNKSKEFYQYDASGFWREMKYYDENGLVVKDDNFMNKTTLMQRSITKYDSNSLPVLKAYGAEDVTFDAAKEKTIYVYEYY